MNKSVFYSILGALSISAIKIKRTGKNLEVIEWTTDNGKKNSVKARHIGSGSFSKIYLDESANTVYAVTQATDRSKYILSKIYKRNPNQHLPKIEYLGRKDKDGELYWITRMPLYSEIKKSDSIYETISFLRESSREWSLREFESTCFGVEQKYRKSGKHASKKVMSEKSSALRGSLINYLENKAGSQPQIQSVIESFKIIDSYLEKYENNSVMDFDIMREGLSYENFMKDHNNNIILVDPIFANNIPSCRKFTVDWIGVTDNSIPNDTDEFLREIGFQS